MEKSITLCGHHIRLIFTPNQINPKKKICSMYRSGMSMKKFNEIKSRKIHYKLGRYKN